MLNIAQNPAWNRKRNLQMNRDTQTWRKNIARISKHVTEPFPRYVLRVFLRYDLENKGHPKSIYIDRRNLR